jgi:hypothetical protein
MLGDVVHRDIVPDRIGVMFERMKVEMGRGFPRLDGRGMRCGGIVACVGEGQQVARGVPVASVKIGRMPVS